MRFYVTLKHSLMRAMIIAAWRSSKLLRLLLLHTVSRFVLRRHGVNAFVVLLQLLSSTSTSLCDKVPLMPRLSRRMLRFDIFIKLTMVKAQRALRAFVPPS
jgi:hypothetical protein